MSHGRLGIATGIIIALAALFVMFGEAVRAEAPGKPINLEATRSGRAVTLTWDPPTSGNVKSYNIEQIVSGRYPDAVNLYSPATNCTTHTYNGAYARAQPTASGSLAYSTPMTFSRATSRPGLTT